MVCNHYAENEGIEPSCQLRQRYSKPTQYHSVQFSDLCPNWDLNPEPYGYKTHALPLELHGQLKITCSSQLIISLNN